MTDSQKPLDRVKDIFRGTKDAKESTKPAAKTKRGTDKEPAKAEAPTKKPRTVKSELRESMEAVVVAFILAFLFRTFEAEAFVIPTGSMAPTLLGRNKETHCPQCGQHIVVGASDEIQQETGLLDPLGGFVNTAICPNCRYEVSLADLPVFTGDRILVTKFPYEMGEPDRWDVIVFKYPQDPQTNYIKRLVGLPGEELQIMQGDIYARESQNGKWEILRKQDPGKQRELQQLVYDNNHLERALHELGWPKRWAAMTDTGSGETEPGELIAGWTEDQNSWQSSDEGKSFELSSDKTSDGNFRWLRYRHIVPDPSDWERILKQGELAGLDPWDRLQIVTDFCGYNAYTTKGGRNLNDQGDGYYWVGDLTVNFQANVESDDGGELMVELNEGPRQYRCRIDLATGTATLFYPDVKSRDESEVIVLGTAQTNVNGPGTYGIGFANVDNRLCLWVDDDLIDFGRSDEGQIFAEYKPFGGDNVRQIPQDRDLIPVGIAAKGAAVTVSDLRIERDIYYRGESVHFNPHVTDMNEDGRADPTRFEGSPHSEYHGSISLLLSRVSDPAAWYEEYAKNSEPSVRFEQLGEDEFFVLGDNSPRSKDSRLWTPHRPGPPWLDGGWAERGHAVPRVALVGKAFFIYWPHAKPFLNDGKGFPVTYHKGPRGEKTDYPNYRFPFYPDFSRMERIR